MGGEGGGQHRVLSGSCLHSASGVHSAWSEAGLAGTAQARSWSPPQASLLRLPAPSLLLPVGSPLQGRVLLCPFPDTPGTLPAPARSRAWPAPSQERQLQPVVASAHSHPRWAFPAASLLHPPLRLLSSVSLSSFPLDLGAEGKQLGEGAGGAQ
uniref:Uncharacterized protein n=1 Tax=Pipistrellus kuhlii TaxID=59472 RepID=A0A7J8B1Y6_PIPKU|nr:hypothetical protein mPipKuh1_007705 [Pipistrellus kuhlii]